ncbi:MAG TPA: hypothetical protein VEW69_11220, partial [Alphaproteobacteria bacterium]|nr:hypothetical protein [Alphaproteobacteria bacterium]
MTQRPSLRIDAALDQVVVAEQDRIYVLSSYGEQRWETQLSKRFRARTPVFPIELPTRWAMLQRLGLNETASSVQTASLRIALVPNSDGGNSRPQFAGQGVYDCAGL